MTRVRVKGFKIFTDKKPPYRVRCYHRATGIKVDLEKHPIGSAGFLAECERIRTKMEAKPAPKPGTLGLLIRDYRASDHFKSRSAKTKKSYNAVFEYLRKIDDTPLVLIDPPFIAKLRDRAGRRGYSAGNDVKRTLSAVFGWSIEYGHVKVNPCRGVKAIPRPKDKPRANRPWADAERFVVLERAPDHMRVPLAIMMYVGLDPCDTFPLMRTQYRDGCIDQNRAKTGEPVWRPVPAVLREIIDAAPVHNAVTLCATSYGRPWTVDGFNSSWLRFRKKLIEEGLIEEGLTLKGLRHSHGTLLADEEIEAGVIAHALGQKTEAMAKHYSRDAKRRRSMDRLVETIDAAENRRRTEIVKPFPKTVKPDNGGNA